jgi:hypothetical protein
MSSRLTFLAAAAAGLAVGVFGAFLVDVPSPAAPEPVAPAEPRSEPASTTVPHTSILLAWSHGGLPDDFALSAAVVPGVARASVVRGDRLDVVASWAADGTPIDRTGPGFAIPLDAIAVDPATYESFVPARDRPSFSHLDGDSVLLGATSAGLRRLGPGAVIELASGRRVRVLAVVDDDLVGAAELIASTSSPVAVEIPDRRYVLVGYQGDRSAVERAVRDAFPRSVAVRFRAAGETPFLRHGDAVLPQALIKQRFGEFSIRRGDGSEVVPEPSWVRENIVEADVPILGTVRCHRGVLDALRGALGDLQQRNLAYIVDPAGSGGCWTPALISADDGSAVSRHAWGIGIDVNYPKNPSGLASSQDPRLVEVMEQWGFTWGGDWLQPDPSYFEYVGARHR